MNIDINEVLADMLTAMKGQVTDDWGEVKPVANQFLTRRKERLELLAQLRIDKEITEAKFKSMLQDEKKMTEAELHTVAVISRVMAQNAANAAMDVLDKAVDAALKGLL